jgi:hypothetical protein
LCALIVVGGRGTDRIGEVEGIPPELAVEPVVGLLIPWFDIGAVLPKLCGGRGTKRPAGAGMDLALVDGPSGARLDAGVAVL